MRLRPLALPLALSLALPLTSGCGHHGGATDAGPTDAGDDARIIDDGVSCNGSPVLCERRYDQVTFAGTHNAFSTREENFGAANQTHVVPTQLEDGIRVLHMETFRFDDDDYVCHGYCTVGKKPLVEAFSDVRAFLDRHRREVVTLLLETNDGITVEQITADLDAAGLTRYLHPQTWGQPWPTLGQLIEENERLVVLADSDTDGGPPYPAWWLDRWKYTWETAWEVNEPDEFTCALDRGTAGAPLYTVDNFLDSPIEDVVPKPERAALVNHDPFLVERLLGCQQEAGQRPNIVLVNYYDVGDVFAAVATLNGLMAPPDGGTSGDGGVSDGGTMDGGVTSDGGVGDAAMPSNGG